MRSQFLHWALPQQAGELANVLECFNIPRQLERVPALEALRARLAQRGWWVYVPNSLEKVELQT